MSLIRKTVYINRANTFVLTFSDIDADGVATPIDLSSVYSFRLLLVGSAVTEQDFLPSPGDVTDITAGSSGDVRFKLGELTLLNVGTWEMQLAYFPTVLDTVPIQLIHASGPDVVRITVLDIA